jgi:hypothetical protein
MRTSGGFLAVRRARRWLAAQLAPAKETRTPRRTFQLESLEPRQLLAADPIISEFMANNEDTLLDGFGNASDWIEIYNPSNAAVDLTGWHLTDNAADLDKYTFPAKSLAPGGYLTVFASGLATTDPQGNLHTNFSLDNDGEYLALVKPNGTTITSEYGPLGTDFPSLGEDISYGRSQQTTTTTLVDVGATASVLAPTAGNGGSALGTSWTGAAGNEPFNDAAWASGDTGIGYGDFTPPLQVAGTLFVDLDAEDLSAGAASWHNAGTLGDFVRVGNPTVVSIEGRRGLQFNSTAVLDAYQSAVAAPAGLVGASPTRTIETWVYNNGIADEETILAWGHRGGPAGTNMSFNYGGNATFGAIGHWDTPDIGWGTVPTSGQWHHLVYTFDGTTTRVYSDGVLTNSEVLGAGVINTYAGTKITLAAQLEGDGVSLNAALRGTLTLGKVRIHDGVLSDSQILSNYQLERPLFPLPTPPMPQPLTAPPAHRYSFNDGTANDSIGARNGTLVAGANISGGSVNLAGGGQYVDFGTNDIASLATAHGAVTMEAWGTYSTASGTWSRIYDFGNVTGTAGINYVFLTPRSGGTPATRAAVSDATSGANRENLTDGPLSTTGVPVHIAAVYDDTNNSMSIYVNGTLASTANMDISLSVVSNLRAYLGKSLYSADPYLNGSIDEFRIYDYALSSNQILGNYQAGPNTVNLGGPSPAAAVEAPPIGLDTRDQMQNISSTAFVRIPFTVANPATFSTLSLDMRYDDGFVAYLNGVEVARRNAPASVAWDSAATAARDIAQAITPETIDLSSFLPALRAGTNILAIEGLNVSASDDDFLILPQLTATAIATSDARYFTTPTPGSANNAGVVGFVEDTQFSIDRGYYSAPFDVTIGTPTLGATIVYTTNGSEPTLTNGTAVPPANESAPGQAVLHIAHTTPLRVRAFKTDWQPTNVDTQTYIFTADVVTQSLAGALAQGFPNNWGPNVVDYDVDPDVTGNPAYASTFQDDLKTIPTVSIVIDNDDFFGAANGVYANAQSRGDAWEQPTSIEWIDPADPLHTYQEDAGLRAFGGVGRSLDRAKHSLRVAFREEYGASKFDAPIFPDTPVDEHNGLVLKMNWNYSWTGDSGGQTQRADYLRETFARDTARDLGLPVAKGRPIQLYINGLYWGLYFAIERTDEHWAAETFGGSEDDYDVLKPVAESFANTPIEVVSGDRTAWDQLMAAANQNLAEAANYQAVAQLVDVDSLIDYMLTSFYTGSRDAPTLLGTTNEPRNFWAVRNRFGGKFQFLVWDMEWSLEDPTVDRVNVNYTAGHDNPAMLFSRLTANADFKQRVADRVRALFFDGGALTPEKSQARYMARANEIDRAIVGESARWGDFLRPAQPYTRNVEWVAERDRLVNVYLAQRTGIVLSQLRTAGLYPAIDASGHKINGQPNFGGAVLPGASLTISDPNAPAGTIYYTLDGTDPKVPSSGSTSSVILVDTTTTAKAFVPKTTNGGSALGLTWTGAAANEPFDDSAWLANPGNAAIGFDSNAVPQDYKTLINNAALVSTLQSQMQTVDPKTASAFVRIAFSVANQAAIDSLDALTLRMKYDDGFVAYLNGTRIAGANDPAVLAYNSVATALHDDNAAVVFQDFAVSQTPQSLLRVGTNMLAIQILNNSIASTDVLALPQLVGLDIAGDVASTALAYTGPIAIGSTTEVKSRIKRGATWSALTDSIYTVDVPIRVTEINYHPSNSTDAEIAAGFTDSEAFEFVELYNTSATDAFDLTGMQFVDGIQLTLGSVSLAPHEYAVIVRDQEAFQFRYGTNVRVVGVYGGTPEDVKLSNSGETLTLLDSASGEVQSFQYDDDWQPTTDGDGMTLVLLDPLAAKSTWNDATSWRASRDSGGSPGDPDFIHGDFDRDDDVDLTDLAWLQAQLGQATVGGPLAGDLDRSGMLDRSDVAQFAANFGRSGAPTAGAPAAPAAIVAGAQKLVLTARRPRVASTIAPAAVALDASLDAAIGETSLSAIRQRRSSR